MRIPRRLGKTFVRRAIKGPPKPNLKAIKQASKVELTLRKMDVEIERLEQIARTMPASEEEMRRAAHEAALGKFLVKRAVKKEGKAATRVHAAEDAIRAAEGAVAGRKADLDAPKERLEFRKRRLEVAEHLRFAKGIRAWWRGRRVKGAQKALGKAESRVKQAEAALEETRKGLEVAQKLHRERTAAVSVRVSKIYRTLVAEKQEVLQRLGQLRAERTRLERRLAVLRGLESSDYLREEPVAEAEPRREKDEVPAGTH